jgi:hypothetical protein
MTCSILINILIIELTCNSKGGYNPQPCSIIMFFLLKLLPELIRQIKHFQCV